MQVKTYTQTHTHRQYWAKKINTPTVLEDAHLYPEYVLQKRKKERKRNKIREFSEWIKIFFRTVFSGS